MNTKEKSIFDYMISGEIYKHLEPNLFKLNPQKQITISLSIKYNEINSNHHNWTETQIKSLQLAENKLNSLIPMQTQEKYDITSEIYDGSEEINIIFTLTEK